MAIEDFMEPEVAVAVAITAAVSSPRVREVLRKGAVYGLAGVYMAGDAISSMARGAKRGFQEAAPAAASDAGGSPANGKLDGAEHAAPRRNRKTADADKAGE